MPSSRPPLAATVLLAIVAVLFARPSAAQTYTPTLPDNSLSPADPIGVPPQPSKAGTHEAVSNTNGGLSFFLPVLSLPQRGGWDLTLGLLNTSPSFTTRSDSSTQIRNQNPAPALTYITYNNWVELAATGGPLTWNVPSLRASIEYAGQVDDCIGCSSGPNYVPVVCITNWVFTDWAGNSHSFSNTTECSSTFFQQTAQVTDSSDGSWLRLDTTNYHSNITVRTKDGTTYNFPGWSTSADPFAGGGCSGPTCTVTTNANFYSKAFSSIVDNTGQNTITYNGSTLTDTLGRTITFAGSNGNSSLTYKDSSGTAQTINVTLTQQPTQNYSFSLVCSPGKSYPNLTVTEDYSSTS